MSRISIIDLEVFYCVGVSAEERAKPQRLLISADMEFDFSIAGRTDRLEKTIDYFTVSQELLKYGDNRTWKLLEKLVTDLCDMILFKFEPETVTVEVKKFPIPQARYVSVGMTRRR